MLGGFSQGAVMSWALGLGRGATKRPAAIVALSGFLPRVDGLELDVTDLQGFPVAIGHGALDPVIDVRFGREAKELVDGAGADLLYREYPLPHTIDPGFIRDLQAFVADATR